MTVQAVESKQSKKYVMFLSPHISPADPQVYKLSLRHTFHQGRIQQRQDWHGKEHVDYKSNVRKKTKNKTREGKILKLWETIREAFFMTHSYFLHSVLLNQWFQPSGYKWSLSYTVPSVGLSGVQSDFQAHHAFRLTRLTNQPSLCRSGHEFYSNTLWWHQWQPTCWLLSATHSYSKKY